MLIFPNAKINLGLNIVAKRPDAYHNIESIFYPIALRDALEFVEKKAGEPTTLQMSGITIDGDADDNLVLKAYRLLQADFSLPPLNIYLQKNIPAGAGLGGGSADGAFMLTMLNRYFNLNLTKEQLLTYAVQLGSDCAFFTLNKPVFASGRGEEISPVELSLKDYRLMLIKPPVHVSTADAYSGCIPKIPAENLRDIIRQPIEMWRTKMVNDFEETVFARHPQIAELKAELYRQGAIYASMSGSGSSVFGIFTQEKSLQGSFPDCFVWEGDFL